MFIEALFTIAKIWEQPKCPLTGEWIKKKKWYMYQCTTTHSEKRIKMPFAAT